MLLFSTVLDIDNSLSKDAFIQLVIKWNKETPHAENIIPGISEEEFQQIVNSVLRNHPDVESYRFFDMGVRVTVFSRSGKSKWSTDLNFNDGGRITGRYTYTQSYDGAALPWELGNRISGLIKSALLR